VTAEEIPGQVQVGGFVLAGGRSTRFGRDKALARIGDEALLARLCAVLRGVTPCVTIIGSREKYAAFGADCVADHWPGEGPLGGIITALHTALETGGGEWNIIVGCDMPFLTSDWLTYLFRRAQASEAQVVMPRSAHGLEPLCACWRANGVEKLQRTFEDGTRKVTEAMKHLTMEVLDETHWKRFDSADRLFWNMNTPGDYEEAKRILEAEHA
jgi:molybdopterin-guanine dinucleotide biosynthesis protein A